MVELGFALHDIVALNSYKKSSGGVLYRIVEDVPPVIPAFTSKKVMRRPTRYDPKTNKYVKLEKREETKYGMWDKDGNKLLEASRYGYVRIKPVFELFATSKGKNPTGKDGTLLIAYWELVHGAVKRIDIVDLGTKYVEFGNLIKDLANYHGTDDEAT